MARRRKRASIIGDQLPQGCGVGDTRPSALPDLPSKIFFGLDDSPAQEKGQTIKHARVAQDRIIGILQAHEAGAKCPSVPQARHVGGGILYPWRCSFGGMTAPSDGRFCRFEPDQKTIRWIVLPAVEMAGKPGVIVSDKGTDLIANANMDWYAAHHVNWQDIAPRYPATVCMQTMTGGNPCRMATPGPVPVLFRSISHVRRPCVRRPRGFSLPMLNADGAGYRSR